MDKERICKSCGNPKWDDGSSTATPKICDCPKEDRLSDLEKRIFELEMESATTVNVFENKPPMRECCGEKECKHNWIQDEPIKGFHSCDKCGLVQRIGKIKSEPKTNWEQNMRAYHETDSELTDEQAEEKIKYIKELLSSQKSELLSDIEKWVMGDLGEYPDKYNRFLKFLDSLK